MKKMTLSPSVLVAAFAIAFFVEQATHADVVLFEASPTNTTVVGNNFQDVDNAALTTVTGALPDLIVTNSGGNFSNTGFVSSDDIDALLSSAGLPGLQSSDTLTYNLTVGEITGGTLRSQGIFFGAGGGPATFQRTDGLQLQLAASNAIGLFNEIITHFDGALTDAGVNSTEGEDTLIDGFSIELVANSAGYTFTVGGVDTTPVSSDPFTLTGAFTGTEFVDTFSDSRFYYTAQQQFGGDPALVTAISEASISIARAVPEPSSASLLLIGSLGLVVRRRRK